MAATEKLSLADEAKRAPAKTQSNYVAIGDAAELIGGGTVYLSRNRKSVLKWTAGEPRPPVFVTSDIGTMQQSIPYRAIGTALAHEVIPVAQVVGLYADQERIGALVAALVSDYPDAFADALVDGHEDFVLSLTGEDTEPEPEPEPEDNGETPPIEAGDLDL